MTVIVILKRNSFLRMWLRSDRQSAWPKHSLFFILVTIWASLKYDTVDLSQPIAEGIKKIL